MSHLTTVKKQDKGRIVYMTVTYGSSDERPEYNHLIWAVLTPPTMNTCNLPHIQKFSAFGIGYYS